eukprot:364393-Chlamydomonas_euryale.AAC.3
MVAPPQSPQAVAMAKPFGCGTLRCAGLGFRITQWRAFAPGGAAWQYKLHTRRAFQRHRARGPWHGAVHRRDADHCAALVLRYLTDAPWCAPLVDGCALVRSGSGWMHLGALR